MTSAAGRAEGRWFHRAERAWRREAALTEMSRSKISCLDKKPFGVRSNLQTFASLTPKPRPSPTPRKHQTKKTDNPQAKMQMRAGTFRKRGCPTLPSLCRPRPSPLCLTRPNWSTHWLGMRLADVGCRSADEQADGGMQSPYQSTCTCTSYIGDKSALPASVPGEGRAGRDERR